MAIPSEADFKSYFSVAKWELSDDLQDKIRTIEPTFDCVKSVLLEIQQAQIKHRDTAYAHDVMTWFNKQPSVIRAMAVLRSGKKASLEVHFGEDLNVRAQWYVVDAAKRDKDSWRSTLQSVSENTPLWEKGGLINALYNYLYSDRWQQVVQIGRDAQKTIERALEAIQTLENLHQKLELLDEFFRGNNRLVLGIRPGKTDRINSNLKSGGFVFPAIREDETARERVLVYDLSQMFHDNYRSYKQTAIFHLLMTEGVEHPLDQRTIERMVEQWRNKTKELNRRLYPEYYK